MVLRAVTVAADPRHVAAILRRVLLAALGLLGHQLRGVETGLDPFGEFDLFLGVEQRDLADLLEVGAHRIGRSGEFGVLAGLPQRLGFLFVPDEVAGGLVLLARFGDLVVLGRRRRRFLARFGCGFGVVVVRARAVGSFLCTRFLVDLEVFEFEIRLLYLEVIAGLGFEVVVALDLVGEVLVNDAGFGRGGLLGAATRGRRVVGGLGAPR